MDPSALPEEFRLAVAQLRAARLRPEVFCEEMPAPQRIAPFASALSADVTVDGEDVGTGRHRAAARPGRQRRLGGHLPLRGLRPRRDRPRDGQRPAARRGRLVLADRGARRARRDVRRARRAPSPRSPRRASAAWPTRSPAPSSRSAPPGRRSATRRRRAARPRPARRGVGRAAVHRRPACRRCPRASRRCRAGADSAAEADGGSTPETPSRPEAAAAEDEPPEPAPLLELRDGLPPVVDTPEALRRGGRGVRRRHRPGRDRRRARVRLPLLRPRLPRPAAPRGLRHRAGRPDRLRRPRPRSTRRSATPSGSCTPPPRTSPAWPRSACARPRCSTPSSPAGCSATPGSGWPRWSRRSWAAACARSTPRSTGRRGRCPSRGWSTPPSTSRCSSSCARRSAASSRRPARPSGPARSSSTSSAPSRTAPAQDPWRRTSGMHRARGRRALAAVRELWETRDEIAARRDVTPGRIIPDSAIVEAANAMPRDKAALLGAPRASAAAAPSATPTSGSRRCGRPARCPTTSCPPSPHGTTDRRRPAPGPTATRSPRPG